MSICAGLNEDPHFIKDLPDEHGLKASGPSAHCPLMRPGISLMYLRRAIRFASLTGAPVINTDESYRPAWVVGDQAGPVMTCTLKAALRVAARRLEHLNALPAA